MKKILISVASISVAIFIILGYKAYIFYKRINTSKTVSSSSSIKKQEKKIYNILLLGYGGGSHDGTYLTDSMMVVHIDLSQKKIAMISVPRDIWVKLPTKSGTDVHEKINAVYQMGLYPDNYPDVDVKGEGQPASADLVKRVIGPVFGLPIDNNISIDFDGFKRAVDILGGVDVNVLKTFDDYEYPVDGKEKDLCGKTEADLPELEKIASDSPSLAFPCRYEHLHFDQGTTHMNGETALKYVRSRHSLQDGSDFGRAARQQRFLEAVKDKIISAGFITKIVPLMDEMSSYIKTDIDLALFQKFSPLLYKSKEFKNISIIPSYENYLKSSTSSYGGYILIPETGIDNWEEVQSWVKTSIITGSSLTPTPTPTNTPTPLAKP